MALALLIFVLALLWVNLGTCHVVEGSVSCLDCAYHNQSGIRVAVKCNQEKQLVFAITDAKGSFKAKLPFKESPTSPSPSPNCLAMLLGGPIKLCSYKITMVSNIVKPHHSDHYTTSTPLTFFTTTCPSKTKLLNPSGDAKKHGKNPEIEASKTVDLPLPPEWGFPPTSYYFPILPIIGIP